MGRKLTALAGGVAALALPLAAAAPAAAQDNGGDGTQLFQGQIGALNESGATGTVTVALDTSTNMATINVDASGVLAGVPHAQHLHFGPDATHTCPDESLSNREAGNDVQDEPQVLASVEARPAYGPVQISLTTNGAPTGPEAALNLMDFPTAPGGTIEYERTIKLSDQQVQRLTTGKFVFAAHGIDSIVQDGQYSPETAPSPLAVAALPGNQGQSVPLEGTAPYGCAVLTAAAEGAAPEVGDQMEAVPEGAVDTGDGSTAGIENAGLLALGGTAVLGAGAAFAARRRFRNQS